MRGFQAAQYSSPPGLRKFVNRTGTDLPNASTLLHRRAFGSAIFLALFNHDTEPVDLKTAQVHLIVLRFY